MFCRVIVVSVIVNILVTGAPQAGEKVEDDPLVTVQRSALRAHNSQFPYQGGFVLNPKTWPCSALESFHLAEATPLVTSLALFSEEAQSNFIWELGRHLQAGTALPKLWHGLPTSPSEVISKTDTLELLKAVSVNFTLASSEDCGRVINEPYRSLETSRINGRRTALVWNSVFKRNLKKVLVLNENLPSLLNHFHHSQSWTLLESLIRHNDNALLSVVIDLKAQLDTYNLPEVVTKLEEIEAADLTSAVETLKSRATSSEAKTLIVEQRCDALERELAKVPTKPGESPTVSASQFSILASRISVLEEASRATEIRLVKLEADSETLSVASGTLTANLNSVVTAVAKVESAVRVLESKTSAPPSPPPSSSSSSGSPSSPSTSIAALITPLSPVFPPSDRSRRTSRSPEVSKGGSRTLSETKTLRGVSHYITLTGNLVRDVNSIGRKLNHLINNVKSVTNKVENEHSTLSFESPFPWVPKLYPNLTRGSSVEGKVESLSNRLYTWGVNNPKYLAAASFGVCLALILLVLVLAIVSLTRIGKLELALERGRPHHRSDSDVSAPPRGPTRTVRRTRSLEDIASVDRRLRDLYLPHLGYGINNQVLNPTWNYPQQQCAPQPQQAQQFAPQLPQPPSYNQSRSETVEEARARGRAEVKDTVELLRALSPTAPAAPFPSRFDIVYPGFARSGNFNVPQGWTAPPRGVPSSREQVQHEGEGMAMITVSNQSN